MPTTSLCTRTANLNSMPVAAPTRCMAPAATLAAAAADEAEQLSPLQAVHVLAVLQDAVHKLSLLSVIARDPATQAEQLTRTVGDDISRMLTQQKALEGRFHALIGAQPALCTMANKASLRQNQAELQDVGGALRQATKQLCRVLQDSPNVTANLAMVAGCGQALTLLLSGTMDVLASHGTVQPVIEAVLAAELAETHMRELVEAERSATLAVKSLRSNLTTEKEQHEQQVREKQQALQAVKAQVQQEKLQLAVEGSYHANDLSAANQTQRRLQAAELERMQQELAQLQQQLEIEASVRAAAVTCLAAKAAHHAESAAGWHTRREEDVVSKEREIEALRAATKRSLEVLAEAEARLREEEAAKEARDAKAQEEAEEHAAAAELAARQLAATVTIQAAWRGFKTRQAVNGVRKSSSSKKGSAKAKKGGKKK